MGNLARLKHQMSMLLAYEYTTRRLYGPIRVSPFAILIKQNPVMLNEDKFSRARPIFQDQRSPLILFSFRHKQSSISMSHHYCHLSSSSSIIVRVTFNIQAIVIASTLLHPRKEWLQKRKVKHKLVQVRRCGCRIECFTVGDSQVSVELL